MISDADIQPLAADVFRVRIPAAMAHALNCYLWLGPDGVTVVDTGWADSAPVIARAVEQLGQRTSDVERIVLTHFHDDHVGSAAAVAQWSPSAVVAVAGLRRRSTGFRSLHKLHHHPGRPAGLPRLRGPGRLIRDSSREGFALSGAAAGQHGQAVALLAWLAAHRTPRSARISAASAGCAVPAGARDLMHLRVPGFPAGTAAGPGTA